MIVYELDSWLQDLSTHFTLGGCLFSGVKLTKNADPDKYPYNGFGIGFNARGQYSLPDGSVGKNIIIFRVDMSSSVSVYINNKGKDIWILVKGPTEGLNHMLATETQYWINFRRPSIKPCLNLHYNESNSFLFVNATKIYQFKAKDSEIKNIPCV